MKGKYLSKILIKRERKREGKIGEKSEGKQKRLGKVNEDR